jgi:alkyl hydroperoxide reductase subunit F
VELPVQGVFIEIGLIPNSDLVQGVVELNEYGEIVVDCRSRTSVPGIFAAGDVTTVPEKQIIIAAGEGAKAALAAYAYLIGRRL